MAGTLPSLLSSDCIENPLVAVPWFFPAMKRYSPTTLSALQILSRTRAVGTGSEDMSARSSMCLLGAVVPFSSRQRCIVVKKKHPPRKFEMPGTLFPHGSPEDPGVLRLLIEENDYATQYSIRNSRQKG